MADLRYHLESPDARSEAVLRFVFESLGIAAEACPPPALTDGPHLVYGNGLAVGPTGISIAHRPGGDPFWPELLDGASDPDVGGGRVPFDLVDAIGAFLGDRVHDQLGPDALDGHGRLTYPASLPARAGYGQRPIVNLYVEFIGRLLRDRLGLTGRPRWPEGKVAAIGLSHDVDEPERYALLQSAARPWRLRRSPRTYLRDSLRLARARASDNAPGDFWLFDEVMRSEGAAGFTSTFFFATVPFHRVSGAPRDVAYDLRRRPFRKVLRVIAANGFEVGLHASYRAYQSAAGLSSERAELATLAGTEIAGLRHHYWHLGPDVEATLRAHEIAGFRYDSSLAFNDNVGFRRSVALPFRPFDPVLGRPLRTLQLPTFCMDGNLFYRSTDVDAAVGTVAGLIDAIAATNGFGAIDWHIQASYPGNREFREWGTAYQEILGLLASRRDLWSTDLGAIQRWVDGRSAEPGSASAQVGATIPELAARA